MLILKLGILAFMGKSFYSSFLVANLITHTTHSLKLKVKEGIK
jgi:hypothetical protein